MVYLRDATSLRQLNPVSKMAKKPLKEKYIPERSITQIRIGKKEGYFLRYIS